MSFPQLKDKHLEEPLFTANDFASYKKWGKDYVPKKMILCYQHYPYDHFKRKYKGQYEKLNFDHHNFIFKLGDIGFLKINGIGAPNAVTILEELISYGAKEFISFGIAGGLVTPGVFLCDKAVRDEGTSHHYVKGEMYSHPDLGLTNRLAKSLEKNNLSYEVGSTWTTDAPYMETKREIAHYKLKGVKTVEMEASALFAVASLRKVKIASAFVVSDILGEKWDPMFHKLDMKKTVNQLLDACIDCFKKN